MKHLILILLFSISCFAQIDYSSKLDDQSPFRRMFDAPRIEQKKAIWRGLTLDEQNEARVANVLWFIQFKAPTPTELNYLARFVAKLPTITAEEKDEFAAEAEIVFTTERSRLLFGSIGPYIDKPCAGSVKISFMLKNCPCNIGSSFNMSCNNECGTSGASCTETTDGCGFAWWYPCNGKCDTGVQWSDFTA